MAERIDFSRRADLEEQMDGPCSYEELRRCLRDLAIVNRITRAHGPILQWVDEVARTHAAKGRRLRIVDVGCGYGDMLRRIERWAARSGVAVELIGVDVNANASRAAREATPPQSAIEWVNGDVFTRADDADLITASGMTHHLAEEELIRLIAWMETTARVGWCIVDLHRKPVPYGIFSVMMRGPWWHPYIRPDGLRSIRRAFLEEDWLRMCVAAGVDAEAVEIRGHRPARLCVRRVKAA